MFSILCFNSSASSCISCRLEITLQNISPCVYIYNRFSYVSVPYLSVSFFIVLSPVQLPLDLISPLNSSLVWACAVTMCCSSISVEVRFWTLFSYRKFAISLDTSWVPLSVFKALNSPWILYIFSKLSIILLEFTDLKMTTSNYLI